MHRLIDSDYLEVIAEQAYERAISERGAAGAEYGPATPASAPAWEALSEQQRAPYRAGVVECAAALVDAWDGELPEPY